MSEALQKCKSLIVLDLSQNKLKDIAGLIIGKIISVHSVRRDEMRWAEEIRGDGIHSTMTIYNRSTSIPGFVRAMRGLAAQQRVR